MLIKRKLLIVLLASAVMLAVGDGATMYAAPTAGKSGLPDEGGLAQPTSAGVGLAATQSPILGPWINIWTTDSVDNLAPAVAYNSRHDEYLVVWENDRGATRDIYAQRVAGNGTLLSWFAVATNAGSWNYQPDVAYNPVQDEYLIVYTFQVSASDYDIWARLVKWNGDDLGNPRYAEFSINTDNDKQWNPAVAYNSQNNEYLVVYENWWAGGLRDIDARRVDRDGNALGGASGVNIATGAGQERVFPDVAYNAARNEYLVVYTFGVGSSGDIYGKVASANLGTLSSEITICNDSYDQDFPAVAAGLDEYLVVWEDGTWGTNDYDIYARRVSGDGVPQGDPGGFSIADATANLHVEPAVAYGNVYGYLVTWRYASGGTSGDDVYGRSVKPGQDVPWGSQFVIDDGANSQRAPALACGNLGNCLVVEEDNWPGGDYEIRGRFVLSQHVYLPCVLRNY
jgi:hypothetical protein